MKRPDTGKTFLDFDDINRILPPSFKLGPDRISRGVYQAANGDLISISNSKYYESTFSNSWYYVYADRYLEQGVKYMLFTIGLKGLVLVPMDVFQPYKKGCYWKDGLRYGEKRYRIDIKKTDKGLFFVNSSEVHDRLLDVTKYYIPFK